jgi:hypothetical protein
MRKILLLLLMGASLSLHAQDIPDLESDTTGKATVKIKAIHDLTNVETFVMHFLRSKVEYGEIQDGIVFKMLPDRSKFIMVYENARLIAWMKNDDVIKKEVKWNNGDVVTTKFND